MALDLPEERYSSSAIKERINTTAISSPPMPPATDVTQSTPLMADVDAVDVTAVDVKVIIIRSIRVKIYKTYD